MTENPESPQEISTPQASAHEPQPAEAQDEKPTAAAADDFASALENFTTESEEAVREDKVLKGTVLKLTGTHVVVDIGAKSEGMLPLSEVLDFEGKPKFQPGDEIDVMRDKGETEEGYINLSHQKAQKLRAWDEIEKAYNE
jgi:small subunit ribosomal protein S1